MVLQPVTQLKVMLAPALSSRRRWGRGQGRVRLVAVWSTRGAAREALRGWAWGSAAVCAGGGDNKGWWCVCGRLDERLLCSERPHTVFLVRRRVHTPINSPQRSYSLSSVAYPSSEPSSSYSSSAPPPTFDKLACDLGELAFAFSFAFALEHARCCRPSSRSSSSTTTCPPPRRAPTSASRVCAAQRSSDRG